MEGGLAFTFRIRRFSNKQEDLVSIPRSQGSWDVLSFPGVTLPPAFHDLSCCAHAQGAAGDNPVSSPGAERRGTRGSVHEQD